MALYICRQFVYLAYVLNRSIVVKHSHMSISFTCRYISYLLYYLHWTLYITADTDTICCIAAEHQEQHSRCLPYGSSNSSNSSQCLFPILCTIWVEFVFHFFPICSFSISLFKVAQVMCLIKLIHLKDYLHDKPCVEC